MNKEVEVIPVSDDSLPVITNDGLLALADKAEKQIDAIRKIKSIVLKVTNNQDWVDQNGKPYLQASGGEKVARVFGISWRIDAPVFAQEPDGHFQYTYKGFFSLGGATIEVIGTRSSKDGFFKRYTGSGENRVALPPSEIDKGDVEKAAYTNCIGNGITRLLGIRNLTWEEVEAGGIKRGSTGTVRYGSKAEQDVHSDVSAQRQGHLKRVQEALVRLYGTDKKKMADKVIELTTWTPTKGEHAGKEIKGIADYSKLKDTSLSILLSKLEKESPQPKETPPEMCSECREINGEHREGCPNGEKNE